MRVVATYTTLPGREQTLEESVKSLLEQTRKLDAIYIAIPNEAVRLGTQYSEPSDFLKESCVIVKPEQDYGPLTKLYGALAKENDAKTCILSCDDDVIFPPNFVKVLLKKRKIYPNSAICGSGAMFHRGLWFSTVVNSTTPLDKWKSFTGFDVSKHGRAIDIAFGSGGVLYNRGMFPSHKEFFYIMKTRFLTDSDMFHNDDVLISGYLSKHGVERRIFLEIPSVKHVSGEGALSGQPLKMLTRMWRAIVKTQELGYYQDTQYYSINETPAMRSIIFVSLVIAIVLLIVLIWFLVM